MEAIQQIIYSCYSQRSKEGEQFIADHVFGVMFAGNLQINTGGKTHLFKEGDFMFYRKNQLAKFVKIPPVNGDFRSISIIFDPETLRAVSEENKLSMQRRYTGEGIFSLKPNTLFRHFADSLEMYLSSHNEWSNALIQLKVKEAVMMLLSTNPTLQDILFDFSAPGKLDLEAFMNAHYKFNADLSRFAWLTGRSLATFKRDFERIYHMTPNRWLQQQRLKDAYFLIKEKGLKVSDVYLDVGFKDLSHFSYAFKKAYGIAPSRV